MVGSGTVSPMGRQRQPRPPKPPMSELHALFVRRVREEMKARALNPHKLEEYGIKQRTLADVLRGADPRLSTVHAAATALGMKAADLLREGAGHRSTVVQMPRTPRILSPESPTTARQAADRKKVRR